MSNTKPTHVCHIKPTHIDVWHIFLCQLPQRIRGNKLVVKGHKESGVCLTKRWQIRKTLSSLIVPRGTSTTVCPVGCGGVHVVEGLSLNEIWLSYSDLADSTIFTFISSDSLVVILCDPPGPAAGHICRHGVFCLQEPPPPNATVTHCPRSRHFLQSDLAAQWCVTEGQAPGTFKNTTPNNKTQMIQSMNAGRITGNHLLETRGILVLFFLVPFCLPFYETTSSLQWIGCKQGDLRPNLSSRSIRNQ